MSNLDRYHDPYKEPGLEIFQELPDLSQPTTVVYRPAKQQSARQNLKEQLELARELQAIRINEMAGRLAFWAIAGTLALLGLTLTASILKGLITPPPQPVIINPPTPTPQPVQINPNCQIFCGTGN